jgi:hypothetical protein
MLDINYLLIDPMMMACEEHVVMELVKDDEQKKHYKSQTRLVLGSSFRKAEYGYQRLNEIVFMFGFLFGYILDIYEITSDNIDMVYKRINLYERVKGTMFQNYRVTREDVIALVGLKVNASKGTKSQFITRLNKDFEDKKVTRALLLKAYDNPSLMVEKGSSYDLAENEGVVKSYMLGRKENKDHMFSSRQEAKAVSKELS